MLFMSEVSKVYCTLYTEVSRPTQGEGYLEKPSVLVGLAIHHQSV